MLCRTVAESAAVTLDLIAGYEPGDATWAPPPSAPFAEAVGRDPGKLRIGFTHAAADGGRPAPRERARGRGGGEAARVARPRDRADRLRVARRARSSSTFIDLWAGLVSVGVAYAGIARLRAHARRRSSRSPGTCSRRGLQLPSTKYLGSLTRLQQISRELIGWWSDIDVLLTPGLGQRPVPIGTINTQKEDDPFSALIPDSSDFTPYTAVWNVTGQPAISLPLFHGDDGLPTSIQLVGPPIGEELLLTLGVTDRGRAAVGGPASGARRRGRIAGYRQNWTNVPSAGRPSRPIVGVMARENAKVTCTECGFEWYGATAAHALRTVGTCTRCRGELRFNDEPVLPRDQRAGGERPGAPGARQSPLLEAARAPSRRRRAG